MDFSGMFFLITNESACYVSHDSSACLKDDSEQSVTGNRNKTKYNCCLNKKKNAYVMVKKE
jgi:hypothetical protein